MALSSPSKQAKVVIFSLFYRLYVARFSLYCLVIVTGFLHKAGYNNGSSLPTIVAAFYPFLARFDKVDSFSLYPPT